MPCTRTCISPCVQAGSGRINTYPCPYRTLICPLHVPSVVEPASVLVCRLEVARSRRSHSWATHSTMTPGRPGALAHEWRWQVPGGWRRSDISYHIFYHTNSIPVVRLAFLLCTHCLASEVSFPWRNSVRCPGHDPGWPTLWVEGDMLTQRAVRELAREKGAAGTRIPPCFSWGGSGTLCHTIHHMNIDQRSERDATCLLCSQGVLSLA
jgi:hypothetical protein